MQKLHVFLFLWLSLRNKKKKMLLFYFLQDATFVIIPLLKSVCDFQNVP